MFRNLGTVVNQQKLDLTRVNIDNQKLEQRVLDLEKENQRINHLFDLSMIAREEWRHVCDNVRMNHNHHQHIIMSNIAVNPNPNDDDNKHMSSQERLVSGSVLYVCMCTFNNIATPL